MPYVSRLQRLLFVSPSSFNVKVGVDIQLNALALQQNGVWVNKNFQTVWSSSDSSHGSSNGNGSFHGVAAGSFNANAGIYLFDEDPDCPYNGAPCPATYYQGYASGTTVASCAVPTGFGLAVGRDNGDGTLYFQYTWASSTGTYSDLTAAGCSVHENVYPGGSPYSWSSPPYASSNQNANPTIGPPGGVPGADGILQDNHTYGSFASSYAYDTFTATQYYQYSCTCDGSSNVNLQGPIYITRTVSQNGDLTWKYVITKAGYTASINPLP